MSKKKNNKKKETLLAETVEMQKKQAMNLVAQSNVNQQLFGRSYRNQGRDGQKC